jgi:general secretion pathway protein D
VKPTVNPGGLVILEIKQEVSDAARTTTSGINSPTIQQRRLASTVAVQSDESVALGGLIRDSRSETRSGVPLLQDIPVLGSLFRGTTDDFRRTELLVLITPRVVRNAAEARHVTDELRSRLRTVVPLNGRVQ